MMKPNSSLAAMMRQIGKYVTHAELVDIRRHVLAAYMLNRTSKDNLILIEPAEIAEHVLHRLMDHESAADVLNTPAEELMRTVRGD